MRRKEVFAWAMYDWANSAFSTLLITVVLHYLEEVVLPGRLGASIFAWGIGGAMLISAVLSPIVGAMADANRSKRRWLALTAFGGAIAAALMALLPLSQAWLIVAAFVLMTVCFELSLVPYNGFLVEIAEAEMLNRVSTWGFALGYFGGAIPLALAWLLCRWEDKVSLLVEGGCQRAGLLLLGLWWAVFSLPAVLILRDRDAATVRPPQPFLPVAKAAFIEVYRTLRSIRRFPALALFLLAFLFYNDGMRTVITQANTLANKELNFSLDEMCALVLTIQLVALPASLAVGRLADIWGLKPVVLGCLVVWSGLLAAATYVESKPQLWVLGMVLAGVLGGTQAVSRALMAWLTPQSRAAEYFGFYALSGKAASVLGPTQFGFVFYLTGNARWAAISILLFFLIGGCLLWHVDVAAGRRQSLESNAGLLRQESMREAAARKR